MAIKYQLYEKKQSPWGEWEVIAIGNKYVVKKITVNPHQLLSLQLHHHRGEHWIITQGNATVTIGNTEQKLTVSQSIDIPKECKHRLANLTSQPLQLIEVQMGNVLDENDIVRFEDKYNRLLNSVKEKE